MCSSDLLRCGINQELAEYSTSDDHGPRESFDQAFCQAVTIAILGPHAKVVTTYYPDDVTSAEALTAGRIDLIPTHTLDMNHATAAGVTLSSPILYDGVGLLVPLDAHLADARALDNKKICFLAETEVEEALRAWFSRQHLRFVPFPFQEEGEMEAAFVTANCAALAGDLTRLAATRVGFGPLASRYTLLPDVLSRDPLASATPSSDPQLAAIVYWTLEVLLNAEDVGITQKTVASAITSVDPTIRILSGQSGEIGSRLGLRNTWALEVLAATGNYGEIFDRVLGQGSPLKLPRNQNRLARDGGLLYPLPVK